MKQRTLTAVTIVILMAVTMGGAIARAQEKVRLTFAIQGVGTPHGQLEAHLAAEYEKRNSHIQIDVIEVNWDKVAVQMAAGAPPDIFSIETKVFTGFARAGLLADVDSLSRRYGPFAELDQLFPPIVEMHRWQGKLYVLPYRLYIYGMYANTTLLEESGLRLPADTWTWDDYRSIGRKLARDQNGDAVVDIWGVGHDTGLLSRLSPWLWQNGGDWWTSDYSRALLDQPEVYTALDWLASLRTAEIHPPPGISPERSFREGKLGIYGPISNLYVGDLRSSEVPWSWDVVALPQRVQRATLAGSRSWAIPNTARHQKEAWEFAKFLTSWSSQLYRFESIGMIGSNRRMTTLRALRAPSEPPANISMFLESVEYAHPDPSPPNLLKIQTLVLNALQGVWNGNKSARAVGQELLSSVNTLLQAQ